MLYFEILSRTGSYSMFFKNLDRFNFYKAENEVKKGKKKFIEFIDNTLKMKGIDGALTVLKSSGLSVNLFNSKSHRELFEDTIEHIASYCNADQQYKINNIKKNIFIFENLFNQVAEERTKFFNTFENIDEKYKVVSYLISLELYLNEILVDSKENTKNRFIDFSNINDFELKTALYEATIGSTGLILKYFMFQNYEFEGYKRNISPKIIKASQKHIIFSQMWEQLNDILEYWKYSDVTITKEADGKPLFEISDKDFELNNLISNERFINLRESWQLNQINEIQNTYLGKKDDFDRQLSEVTNYLNHLFSVLYFGSPRLDVKIDGIELKYWIYAYQLIIDESKKYLKRRKHLSTLNLDKVCLSKSKENWKRFFEKNGFSRENSIKIINYFTFNKKSLDLIDCPFIEVNDQLIVIPSLTSQADVARALASNFLNENLNMDFKGPNFEERTIKGLELSNIKCSRLYKRDDNTEYECDIAFVLDNELFFVECKAHVQPFTTRQHANHLNKLYNETFQINRIAYFYEVNLHLVKEQLNLKDSFTPKKIHKILLTTSMIGRPMYVNGVHIVDESSFTMFVDRTPPRLDYFGKGASMNIESEKFDVYKGELTAQKMIEFLNSPPQIKIYEELYKERSLSLGLFNVTRNVKVNKTVHMGVKLNKTDKSLIRKFYLET